MLSADILTLGCIKAPYDAGVRDLLQPHLNFAIAKASDRDQCVPGSMT